MRIYVDGKTKMQDGETALLRALGEGHLDVVNRLLDCKEIEVNLQDNVSGNVDFVPSRLPKFFALFFLDVVFNANL